MDVFSKMSFFAKLYGVGNDSGEGMWYLYITIVILSVIVFKLGFAKQLKLWMDIIIYTILVSFCLILTFFAIFLPVAEVLLISAIVLIIYRVRLSSMKEEKNINIRK